MITPTDGAGPISFLRRELRPHWLEEHAAILTMPTYDFDAATQTGAAYRNDGSLILESLRSARLGHWRHVDPVSIDRKAYDHIPLIEGAIFGGHFFNMWGHFLFETLPTALLGADMPDWPVVFAPFAPDAPERFKAVWENFSTLLPAAGWGNRKLLLQTSTIRAHRLIVPERLSVFGLPSGNTGVWSGVSNVYKSIQDKLGDPFTTKRPIVAKRPGWTVRMHPSEAALYDLLEDKGCLILDVVNLTAREQVKAFSAASALIGFSGSNMHNSVFCPEGIPIFEIGDLRSYNANPDNRINPTQLAMSSLMHQRTVFVDSFDGKSGELVARPAAAIAAEIWRLMSSPSESN